MVTIGDGELYIKISQCCKYVNIRLKSCQESKIPQIGQKTLFIWASKSETRNCHNIFLGPVLKISKFCAPSLLIERRNKFWPKRDFDFLPVKKKNF